MVRRRVTRHEPAGALHTSSGDDDVADVGLRHLRPLQLPASSRRRHSPGRFFGHRRQPRSSPETMASSVATPLERQFSTIAGLNSMVSSSGQGVTSITMQFDLSRDIDGAALDVQSALTAAAKRLPIQMTTPPSFIKANPADAPVIFLNLSSAT